MEDVFKDVGMGQGCLLSVMMVIITIWMDVPLNARYRKDILVEEVAHQPQIFAQLSLILIFSLEIRL